MTGRAPASVVVVVAHPDDAEYAAGGTVAGWTRAGAAVVYCVVSSGAATDGAHPREGEQRAAADVLGVADVRFLRRPDGFVDPDIDLQRDIVALVREHRPEIVVTHSPELNWARPVYLHPDHQAVGTAALRAVYPYAREPTLWPDLGSSWSCPALWLIQAPVERTNTVIDITTTIESKVRALSRHRSQLASGPSARQRVFGNARIAASAAGRPSGLVEAFQVVDTSTW